jgi:hypothetical protein
MLRPRARRRTPAIIVVLHQSYARFGMAHELDTRAAQGLGNLPTSMRLVAASGDGDGLLPIGNRIGMKASSIGKLMLGPAEQAACGLDLVTHDDATHNLGHAAILAGCMWSASMMRMPRYTVPSRRLALEPPMAVTLAVKERPNLVSVTASTPPWSAHRQ